MKYIFAKSIGLIFILVSTLIATVKIPCIDRLIKIENENITKFEDQRIIAGISLLKASHIANLKRLYLMEANIVAYTKQERTRQIELRQKALNQDVTEIRNWNTFFSKGEKSELFRQTEAKIKDIVKNKDLGIEKKLEEIETILTDVREQANQRLVAAHQRRDKHKEEKEKLEKKRIIWNMPFIWLQILGIALLTGSEIFEKLLAFTKTP